MLDLYDEGADEGEAPLLTHKQSMGLIDYSPDAISREVDAVNRFASTVNHDMFAEAQRTGNFGFYSTWKNETWEPWKAFYKDFTARLGLGSLRDSNFKQAEAYRVKIAAYRDNLVAKRDEGADVTPTKVPGPVKTPKIPKLPKVSPPPDIAMHTEGRGLGGRPWWQYALGGVAVLGGGYLVYRWLSPTAVAQKALDVPEGLVRNPPPWVQDPDIWESAKLAVGPYKPRYDNPDAVITHVYKQMGGRVGTQPPFDNPRSARKPTIYEALHDKLGREPTNAELRADVERIKGEALVSSAIAGKLRHQRKR